MALSVAVNLVVDMGPSALTATADIRYDLTSLNNLANGNHQF